MTDRLAPPLDASSLRGLHLLTVRGVARRLRVPPPLVYELVLRGDISSVRVGGRLVVPSGALRGFVSDPVARHQARLAVA